MKHGSEWDMEIWQTRGWKCHTRVQPKCDISTEDRHISLSHERLCHMFCRMANYRNLELQVAYSGKTIPSVLWHCWLGGRKGIRPVKELSGADLHTAQLMPLSPTVSCFSKIQIGFTFLVPAHPGSPGQRAVKRVYVCYSGKMWMSIVCHLKMHTVLITVRG